MIDQAKPRIPYTKPSITELDCPVPVVNEKGVYQGAISKNRFLKTLKREG